MDNRRFDIIDQDRLREWIACCVGRQTAIGWSAHARDENGPARLLFFWMAPPKVVRGFTNLPFKATDQDIAIITQRWLDEANYGPEPDHDGDNGKGFRLFCEDWGHVDGHPEAFLAVTTAWAMYGK